MVRPFLSKHKHKECLFTCWIPNCIDDRTHKWKKPYKSMECERCHLKLIYYYTEKIINETQSVIGDRE